MALSRKCWRLLGCGLIAMLAMTSAALACESDGALEADGHGQADQPWYLDGELVLQQSKDWAEWVIMRRYVFTLIRLLQHASQELDWDDLQWNELLLPIAMLCVDLIPPLFIIYARGERAGYRRTPRALPHEAMGA